jgi:ABC-type glycerol-3-phosphate transport system substrate-binding protein
MRGQTYSAIQVILPIWASAGVKFVDEKGNVDFDSPAAIGVTEKWVNLLIKDNAAQPTPVSDGYREQYALMEKGKCGFWYYGPHASPALIKALGDNIQAVNNPRVGPNHYMLANPEGPLMTTSCKEKEAAWEFIKFIASGDALLLYTAKRMVPPVRKSMFQQPGVREQPIHQDVARRLQHVVHAAVLAQELGQFPGQDPAVLAGDAQQEDHGAAFHAQGAKFLRGQA